MARPKARSKAAGCLRVVLAVVLAGALLGAWRCRDRSRGYALDLHLGPAAEPRLEVGFGRAGITPELPDTWTDADRNGKFEAQKGDTWTDGNGNGRFDAIYIAGFGNNRPAAGVLDPIEAIACVVGDGRPGGRVAIVALDAIGFFHDDVIAVRRMVPPALGIAHLIVCSTHCHEVPDLMGLWGKTPFASGVDREYRNLVRRRAIEALVQAAGACRPARMRLFEVPEARDGLVEDTRDPQVFDDDIRVVQFVGEAGETVGTILGWANHPETLWSDNLLISSDFVGPFRRGVEAGVGERPGQGGTAIYLNGAVGGLMTPHRSMPVTDPLTGQVHDEPTPAKARALGQALALRVLEALEGEPLDEPQAPGLALDAVTLRVRMDNKLFRLAPLLGVMDRGFTGVPYLRTELNLLRLGPVWFLTVPGEVYPEIVNGGVEAPDGGDYGGPPLETPPWRDGMRGRLNYVIGLANDEIGYIIPKSQWDTAAPHTYGKDGAPYGEVNSLGPETAPTLHRAVTELLARR